MGTKAGRTSPLMTSGAIQYGLQRLSHSLAVSRRLLLSFVLCLSACQRACLSAWPACLLACLAAYLPLLALACLLLLACSCFLALACLLLLVIACSCLLALACLVLLACLLSCLLACVLACLPACLLACLPACLPSCLPACLLALSPYRVSPVSPVSPVWPVCLSACLPACLSAYLSPSSILSLDYPTGSEVAHQPFQPTNLNLGTHIDMCEWLSLDPRGPARANLRVPARPGVLELAANAKVRQLRLEPHRLSSQYFQPL